MLKSRILRQTIRSASGCSNFSSFLQRPFFSRISRCGAYQSTPPQYCVLRQQCAQFSTNQTTDQRQSAAQPHTRGKTALPVVAVDLDEGEWLFACLGFVFCLTDLEFSVLGHFVPRLLEFHNEHYGTKLRLSDFHTIHTFTEVSSCP